jgi:hypothetical protein
MATSGRGFVFNLGSRGGGGGGGSYAPTGYAAAYSQGKGIMEMIDWQDRKRRESMEEEYMQSREERAIESERLAQERADREQARLDLQFRRTEAAEARRQAREDQLAERMDAMDQVAGAIELIDPLQKDSDKMLQDLSHSKEYTRLMLNRDTRQALKDAFSKKTQELQDFREGIIGIAKNTYGTDVDISKLPTDDQGFYDTQKIYSEYLPMLGQQMAQKAQQTYETASKPGFLKYAESDEYGRPIAKFVEAPKIKPVKQEDVKEEFKATYGAPVESLSMQFGTKPVKGGVSVIRGSFEDGDFKASESGDTVQVVDASKGMSKKVIHNIPYEQFQSFKSKIQGMTAPSQIISSPEGIDISSTIGIQSGSIPQLSQPTATETSTPQQQTIAPTKKSRYNPETGEIEPIQ